MESSSTTSQFPSIFENFSNNFISNIFLILSVLLSIISYIFLSGSNSTSEFKTSLKVLFGTSFASIFIILYYRFYLLIKSPTSFKFPSIDVNVNISYIKILFSILLIIGIILSSTLINFNSDNYYMTLIPATLSIILITHLILNLGDITPYITNAISYIGSIMSNGFGILYSLFETISDFFKYLYDFALNNPGKSVVMCIILAFTILFTQINFPGKTKQIMLGVLVFLIGIMAILFGFDKLYTNLPTDITSSGNKSLKYYIVIGLGILMAIGMLLALFYTKEMFSGNFRNYGMLMFDVVLLGIFLFIIYKFYNKFFTSEPPKLNQSFNDIFMYDYLFPIGFLLIYVLYYFLIYKKDGITYTDYSDYRVIIYNILTFIIIFYLFYQFVKNIFFSSSPTTNFFGHVFETIPCILWEFVSYLMKDPYYGFVSIGSSIVFIYFILSSLGVLYFNYNDWKSILTYIFLGIIGVTLLFKMLVVNTGLDKNKYFNLLSKTIFSIPCLILVGMSKSNLGTPSEYLLLVLLILAIILYELFIGTIFPALFNKYLMKDGEQIINKPISLSKQSTISNTLEKSGRIYDYKYGASFWIYIDSFPAMTDKIYDVCCLGDGLKIKYNPLLNTLFFSYNGEGIDDVTSSKNVIDENNINEWNKYKKNKKNKKRINKNSRQVNNSPEDVIIYKHSDVLLQKWNNIIVNYLSGTLDIFINGTLVKSNINVAPYIENTAITVGTDNGISGHVCNMVYYHSPLNSNSISIIYNTFKERNPPIINNDRLDYWEVAETLRANFDAIFMPKSNEAKNNEIE